jgi:hypothetical protein
MLHFSGIIVRKHNDMTLNDISNIRLANQRITKSEFNRVKDLAGWMCAIQAQDYPMAKWAIGLRIDGGSEKTVNEAIDKGEILRTHLLRPTWHFVSSDDIYWLLELTAPHIRSSMKSRNKELELTDTILKKSVLLITDVLQGGIHLTREEMIRILEKSGIATKNNRGSHILSEAELGGIICSGESKGNKQTYALLNERVKENKKLSREDALEKIAGKYFSSHGPATIKDFVWWSGLPVKDARNAIEMAKPHLSGEIIDSSIYYYKETSWFAEKTVCLLPAYDEFIISYKDRTASLSSLDQSKAVSINGLFRPMIVINGQISGLWKRTLIKETIFIETLLFKNQNKQIRNLIENEAEALGAFLNRKVEVKII